MKKILGTLFFLWGMICLREVFSPNMATMIGRLIATLLTSFIPAYFLLRENGHKTQEDQLSKSGNQLTAQHSIKRLIVNMLYIIGIVMLCMLILSQIIMM